jgi:uncharacterized protein YbaR (Trm112 family)
MPSDQSIPNELLAILACPQDRGPLTWIAHAGILHNPRLRRGYPSREGIVQLTIPAAVELDGAATTGEPDRQRSGS